VSTLASQVIRSQRRDLQRLMRSMGLPRARVRQFTLKLNEKQIEAATRSLEQVLETRARTVERARSH
jgi:transposase InsO family protein